ncbi:ABC transporter permease [Parvibaculum sp.]|uniref:ABC transporter permease n=1 Tax=Parvibaculum sp. TaxID=2024848 RepID=UPI0032112038
MFLETLLLAFREIRRNVMRSALTMLGIMIGVAAVIAMVTLGGGAKQRVSNDISSLGKNLLMVMPGTHQRGPSSGGAPFKNEDVQAIKRSIDGVQAVAPMSTSSVRAVYGNTNWTTTVSGTTNAYFEARQWAVEKGRLFDEAEERSGRTVCLIGATVHKNLFGQQDPIGARIRLGTGSCEVIGLLEGKGSSGFGSDQDDTVIMPLFAFQRRISGVDDVSMIFISARSEGSIDKVKAATEALLRQRRHIVGGKEDDFQVQDMREIASLVESTTTLLTAFLGAVAAISLLVGGIGIMNIMLVSVTERTREIGIRLAIGAYEREVLLQFLVEAGSLSLAGGIVGILIGLAISAFVAPMVGIPFVLNLWIIGVAFVFSAAVGVVFGYFPARNAARLDPIEALRYE